jgi:tetratricopeptide (TPR) repeat protein
MKLDQQQIRDLVEAQYHLFESRRPEKAAEIIGRLVESLFETGRFPELLYMLEQVLNEIPHPEPRLIVFHARTLTNLGRHEEALAELELVELQVKTDWVLHAAVLVDMSNALRRLGDVLATDRMISNYRKAFDLYTAGLKSETLGNEEKSAHRENQGTCLFDEAAIYLYFLENPNGAMDRYLEALRIFEDVKSEEGIGLTFKQLGEIYGSKSYREFYNPSLADEYFSKALAKFDALGLQQRRFETLYQVGLQQKTNPERALAVFRECGQIAHNLGLLREEAIAGRYIAELEFLSYEKRPESAHRSKEIGAIYARTVEALRDSARILETLKSDNWSRDVLADCYYLQGRLCLQADLFDMSLDLFRNSLRVRSDPVPQNRLKHARKQRLKAILRIIELSFLSNSPPDTQRFYADFHDDLEILGIRQLDRGNLSEFIRELETED